MPYAFTQLNLDALVSFTALNNWSSRPRRVMEKIGMHYDPDDDFEHPNIAFTSPLRPHVLYRLSKKDYLSSASIK
ncbi:GNAT family N-acetyltransferase [Legionella sp. CNM-1927-20]|uniref:GNAT family N-acetyltransferase n=1 Tax=Legionella sp. CNM-1927-20 TaxID=3422221 RepID=UPI00403AC08D